MILSRVTRTWFSRVGLCISLAITVFVAFRARQDTLLQRFEKQDLADAIHGMLEHGTFGYAILTEQGQVVEWNLALEKLTGWSKESLQISGLQKIMTPKLWKKHKPAFDAAMKAADLSKVRTVICEVKSPSPNGPSVSVRVTVRIVRGRYGSLFAIAQIDPVSQIIEPIKVKDA